MNVTCTNCPAKYAVPDEKVRGKKVRITCKHCGTQIIIDGTAPAAEESTVIQRPPATPQAEVSYLVGFPDDSQRPHTVSEIVAMYDGRRIDDEAVVWKDGMLDWLSPFDVPEIAEAMRARNVVRRGHDTSNALASGIASESASAPVALGAGASEVVTKGAARRQEQRLAGKDLFAGVAHAGSEADSSLDFGSADDGHKLTGARNESSVLFSLDSLTKPETKLTGQKAREREQEKQSAELFGTNAPDSLINLGGGGFEALTAPDFTKPVSVVEPSTPASDATEDPAPPKKRGAGVLMGALVGGALAAGGVYLAMQPKLLNRSEGPAAGTPVAEKSTTPEAPPAPVASGAEAAPSVASAPSSSAAEALPGGAGNGSSASPSESIAQALTAAGSKPSGTVTSHGSTPAPAVNRPNAKSANEPVPSKAPDAPTPSTTPTPPVADDGAAFDKSAAVTALGAAAANAASCKTPTGPTGSGKVSVTFAPSGRATMTNVAGVFAGTEVGGCVARLFRAAKVPAFSGDPVTVSKGFSIE